MRQRHLYPGLTGLLLLLVTYAHAQIEYSTGQNVRIYAPAFKQYSDIEGSPYIPGDTVQNGWLLNGTKRIATKLRYNSITGEVEYVQGDKIVTPVNSISEFMILAADTLHFQKGFPAIGPRSTANYYQILFDGRKTKLIKFIHSDIKVNNDAMHKDFGKKKLLKREEYYVWVANEQPPAENYFLKLSDGQMKPVVASKKSLVDALPQQADRIGQYSVDQKVKLKSWSEVAGVLRYLETL